MNRTKNTIRNFIWYIYLTILTTLMPFFIRTILIRKIGIEYVGVSGVFASVIQLLNLADLGFASAIVVYLYKPVADGKYTEINAILNLLRICYKKIGSVILIMGIILMPIIPFLIKGKEYPEDINIYTIYIIYVLNCAMPYLAGWYKEIIFRADQRADLIYRISGITTGLMYGFQILELCIWKNYFLYTLLMLINPIIYSIFIWGYSRRHYPKLKPQGNVNDILKKEFYRKVFAIGLSKIRGVSRNSFDCLTISALMGITFAAQYQNYYQLMLAAFFLISAVYRGIQPSFGNCVATESIEHNKSVLNIYIFIQNLVMTISLSCLLNVFQPVMKIWVGEENMLTNDTVVLFCVYYYLLTIADIPCLLREVTGIWWEGVGFSIVEALVNLVLNILLCQKYGVNGVIISSILVVLFINLPVEFHYCFKYYFRESPKGCFVDIARNGMITLICLITTYVTCSHLDFSGISEIIIKLIVSIVMSVIILLLCNSKSAILHDGMSLICGMLKNKRSEK